MPVYRIDLAYDGSGFSGYARQDGSRTVESELEGALGRILSRRDPPTTSVAGRTDAGVHAVGQVVSLAYPETLDTARVARHLNRMLNPEIVISAVSEAAGDFDARHSARGRTYHFDILNSPLPDPFRRDTVWHITEPLDVSRMNAAVRHLVGPHDFASFCRSREGRTTEREIASAEWSKAADTLRLVITARAFCHQMVRSIVALCVEVGRGRVDPDAVPTILAARDRNAARGVAPPQGLTLWSVDY